MSAICKSRSENVGSPNPHIYTRPNVDLHKSFIVLEYMYLRCLELCRFFFILFLNIFIKLSFNLLNHVLIYFVKFVKIYG